MRFRSSARPTSPRCSDVYSHIRSLARFTLAHFDPPPSHQHTLLLVIIGKVTRSQMASAATYYIDREQTHQTESPSARVLLMMCDGHDDDDGWMNARAHSNEVLGDLPFKRLRPSLCYKRDALPPIYKASRPRGIAPRVADNSPEDKTSYALWCVRIAHINT